MEISRFERVRRVLAGNEHGYNMMARHTFDIDNDIGQRSVSSVVVRVIEEIIIVELASSKTEQHLRLPDVPT